jgi:hypothetical protein
MVMDEFDTVKVVREMDLYGTTALKYRDGGTEIYVNIAPVT